MTILELLKSINGYGQLWAADGYFLGVLSSNPKDPSSLANPSTYGNPYSTTSIRNPGCPYGGACGAYSPYNISCQQPPVVLYQGQPILLVTKNPYVVTDLPLVDPDLLWDIYEELTPKTPSFDLQDYRLLA